MSKREKVKRTRERQRDRGIDQVREIERVHMRVRRERESFASIEDSICHKPS